jgi:hypothetical protein
MARTLGLAVAALLVAPPGIAVDLLCRAPDGRGALRAACTAAEAPVGVYADEAWTTDTPPRVPLGVVGGAPPPRPTRTAARRSPPPPPRDRRLENQRYAELPRPQPRGLGTVPVWSAPHGGGRASGCSR